MSPLAKPEQYAEAQAPESSEQHERAITFFNVGGQSEDDIGVDERPRGGSFDTGAPQFARVLRDPLVQGRRPSARRRPSSQTSAYSPK